MAFRLRLKFQGGILKKSQRTCGLKRPWILVNPQHETISDVVSHIIHAFDLYHKCPNGVLLAMEGFILPPFMSTSILRDKDLICVERKEAKIVNILDACREERVHLEHNIVEKQISSPCMRLLLNKELETEIIRNECESEEFDNKKETNVLHEENVPNGGVHVKKRKASKELKSSKRKRQCHILHDSDEKDSGKEHHGACVLNGDISNNLSKIKQVHNPEVAEKIPDEVSLDENGEGTNIPRGLSNKTAVTSQSRTARRKKNKRKWLRAEKEQLLKNQSLEDDRNADLRSNKDQNLDTDNHPLQLDGPNDQNLDSVIHHLQPDEDSGTEDEIVPIVVRPGHVRFAAPGKDKDIEHKDEAKSFQEPFNWSGPINKKKGQKWGRENHLAFKWNEKRAPFEHQSSIKADECRSPKEQYSQSRQLDSTPSTNCLTQEVPPENASVENVVSMDYGKLLLTTDSPVEGDIIAYRLVELSSSFCPELTEYRIGRVSWFDPESEMVMLVPVPQYHLDLNKTLDDAFEELPETSCYNEDGSLEIEFQSLVDVRIVKRGEVIPAPAIHDKVNGVSSPGSGLRTEVPEGSNPSNQEQSLRNNAIGVNNPFSSAPEPDSHPGPNAWENGSITMTAKKAELQEEDNWNKKRFWSYRASWSCALGPTLAILRAQNKHETE